MTNIIKEKTDDRVSGRLGYYVSYGELVFRTAQIEANKIVKKSEKICK